jgi:serine/threonine-protein kinase RsbW
MADQEVPPVDNGSGSERRPTVVLPHRGSRGEEEAGDDGVPARAECAFVGTRDGVARARAWQRAWMDAVGVGEPAASDAVLVLSELATNAVLHSRSSGPYGSYLVRLCRGRAWLRVEVVDAGGRTAPRARRRGGLPPRPGAAQESGYGLALVEAVSVGWWICGDETGCTVGAEIALGGSGRGGAGC